MNTMAALFSTMLGVLNFKLDRERPYKLRAILAAPELNTVFPPNGETFMQIYVTTGTGEGLTPLAAFDAAT